MKSSGYNFIRVFCAICLVAFGCLGASEEDIYELDRLAPMSNLRILRAMDLSGEGGREWVDVAIEAFRAHRIQQNTVLDVFKYAGGNVTSESIREALDISWSQSAQSGDFRPYFEWALYYGGPDEAGRVVSTLGRDFDLFGIYAIFAIGDNDDFEKVKAIGRSLEGSGRGDIEALKALSARIASPEEGAPAPPERRQRQALLLMGEGERNIFFAYEICSYQRMGWASLEEAVKEFGCESAVRLLSRSALPEVIEESYFDLLTRIFPNDELLLRLTEAVRESSSFSAAARGVVDPLLRDE